jgi:hypothetical protein
MQKQHIKCTVVAAAIMVMQEQKSSWNVQINDSSSEIIWNKAWDKPTFNLCVIQII